MRMIEGTPRLGKICGLDAIHIKTIGENIECGNGK
jgi:hypothetical protein